MFDNKKTGSIFYSCLLSAVLVTNVVVWNDAAVASEGTSCPIGQQHAQWVDNPDGTRSAPAQPCEPATWAPDEVNDGFDNSLTLYAYPSPNPIQANMPGDGAVAIMCLKKKLSVYFVYPYPYTTGWSGTGRILFDTGKPITYKYTVTRDFQSLSLNSPSDFMKNLVKAKLSFTAKIPLVSGTRLATYAKGDLLNYRAKFAKAGCKF